MVVDLLLPIPSHSNPARWCTPQGSPYALGHKGSASRVEAEPAEGGNMSTRQTQKGVIGTIDEI